VKRLWQATINSWHGLIAATRSEQAFREELAVLAIGTPLALFPTADAGRRLAPVGTLVFVLIVELLNTAIEKLSDRVTLDHDLVVKRVKDMGSAAILLSIVLAGAVWIWIAAAGFGRWLADLSVHKAHAAAPSQALGRTTILPTQKFGSARRG